VIYERNTFQGRLAAVLRELEERPEVARGD
jgi:hypothetical protein